MIGRWPLKPLQLIGQSFASAKSPWDSLRASNDSLRAFNDSVKEFTWSDKWRHRVVEFRCWKKLYKLLGFAARFGSSRKTSKAHLLVHSTLWLRKRSTVAFFHYAATKVPFVGFCWHPALKVTPTSCLRSSSAGLATASACKLHLAFEYHDAEQSFHWILCWEGRRTITKLLIATSPSTHSSHILNLNVMSVATVVSTLAFWVTWALPCSATSVKGLEEWAEGPYSYSLHFWFQGESKLHIETEKNQMCIWFTRTSKQSRMNQENVFAGFCIACLKLRGKVEGSQFHIIITYM